MDGSLLVHNGVIEEDFRRPQTFVRGNCLHEACISLKSIACGQEAPADLKKLIAPMFHIRFVEDYLPSSQSEREMGIPQIQCVVVTHAHIYICITIHICRHQ